MGEGMEIQPAGRVSGLFGSIFRRKRGTDAGVGVPVPPMPQRDELPPPNLKELNLIKQQVQGVSPQVASGDPGAAANPAPKETSAPVEELTLPEKDLQAPPVKPPPEKLQGSALPRKSRLDEVRNHIEESVRRKDPAHLKKNLEQVNAHLSYVKRKSAAGDNKLARLVDEKVREELGKMGASVKQKLASHPGKAEREALENFQQQILGLMDVSDKKSQLELEQMRSQMDGLRRQISGIPDILVQKEIDELSPLKEEVVVLRSELRKALPNVSDAGERAKLEGTLARVEAISRVFGQNPGQDALRSELEGMRVQLGSISAAIEKNRELEAGIDAKSVLEFSGMKEEMEELKKRVHAIPAAVEAAESKGMDSIKDTLSGVRSSVQHLVGEEKKLDGVSAQMDALQRRIDSLSRRVGSVLPEDFGSLRDELRSMRNSIRSILSSSRGREERDLRDSLQKELNQMLVKGEERSAAEFGRLERNLSDVKKRVSTIPSKIDEEKPELDALKKELHSLRSVVGTALSQPKTEEEAKLLRELQSHLDGLLEESESRSLKEMKKLEGEISDVRSSVSRIPSVVGARERPELDSIRSEVVGLQKFISDALSIPRDEEEKQLLRDLQSRLEGLLSDSVSRSAVEFGELRKELSDVRSSVSRIPSVVGARERPELDSIRSEVVGLQKLVSEELSKPRNEDEKKLLKGLQSRLEELSKIGEARSSGEFARLEGGLADVRRMLLRIPAAIAAGEERLSAFMGRDEEKLRQLQELDSRLMDALSRLGERTDDEIGQVRSRIGEVHRQISGLSHRVGTVIPADFESLGAELHSMRESIRASISTSRSREEAELLGSLQKELNAIIGKLEERSGEQFGRIEQDIADVKRQVSGIPAKLEESRPELEALNSELLSVRSLVDRALSQPKNEEEKTLLKGIKSQLSSMASLSEARSSSEFGALREDLNDVKRRLSRIPSVLDARERPELEAIRSEVMGLQRFVGDALARPNNEEEKKLLKGLQSRLEELSRISDARSSAEFGRLEGELTDMRNVVSRIPSVVGARERPELEAIRGEVLGMQKVVSDALSRPKNEEEKRLLKNLQGRLEDLMGASEARSAAGFGRLESGLADVRSRVSRIPSVVGAGEKPELDSIRSGILGLQSVVGDALARPKGEEEKKLLRGLQSRLEELAQISEARSVSEFGRLEKELADVRSTVSRIPGAVGAREKQELEVIRSEVSDLQRMVSDELSRPRNEDEKALLRGLQSRLESLMAASESRSAVEFGELKKGLSDVRSSVSSITSRVEAGTRSGLDAIRGEVLDLQKLVSSALSKPKDEEEKRLLMSLKSRLEGLLEAGESRSASEFGRIEGELSGIRNSISRIPSVVGARERYEFDAVKAELIGLKKAVSDALSRPLDDYQKNILQGLQSRLESLLNVSESRSVAELGKVEGELSDIREKVSRMPGLLVSREKADAGFIQTEIDGLKKVVAEALSKPRDDGERRFLKGMESRLEGLLELSEENSLQHMGELRKELGDVRKKISRIPSSVEAGEKPELDSLRDEMQSVRSAVESALAEPKNEEEKEMLRNVLAQLDSMVKFFDLKAGSALEAVKSRLDAINWQVAEVRAEKGDIDAIANDIHGLGASLKKAVSSIGKNDRQLVGKLSEQIAAISDSLGSEAGSAADSIRSELEGMKAELVSAVSAEKPELESLKEEVERALAKRGNAGIEHELSSIRNQITGMLQASEAKTESDLRSGFASLRKTAGSHPPNAVSGGSLSDIREGITSLRELLEKRNQWPEEARPAKARKKKANNRRKARSGKQVHSARKKPPGGRKSLVRIAHRKTQSAGRGPGGRSARENQSLDRGSWASSAHRKKLYTGRRPGESGARKKKPPERPENTGALSGLKALPERPKTSRSLSGLRAALKDRRISRRGRSDIRSFIAQMEKKQKARAKALPAIERRLGGRYATRGGSKRILNIPHNAKRRIGDGGFELHNGPERRSAGLELDTGRDIPEEGRSRLKGGIEGRSILDGGIEGRSRPKGEGGSQRVLPDGIEDRRVLRGGSEGHRDFLHMDALKGEVDDRRVPLQRSILQDEREPADTERRESAPGRRSGLHGDYESYLRNEKMGRIGSDVKRMHDRLKDIRKLYKEEF